MDKRSSDPMKNEMPNRAMWRQMLTKDLVTLKDMLPTPSDANFASIFEEYLGHHEFGLALDVICDYLLEPTTPPASAFVLEQIQRLHALMEVDRLAALGLGRALRSSG
jgi:hypothetical protein